MIIRKNIFNKVAMSPQYVQEALEKTDLPFDHIFEDGELRKILPLMDVYSSEIKQMLEEGETSTGKQYLVDLQNQTAITETPTNSGPKLMKYRLGKVIQFELGQEWLDKWSRILKGEIRSDRSIILSRSPIDVLRMSDHGDIHSCHSEGEDYFQSARAEALSGGAIAYVVYNKDLAKIEDLQAQEIFKDKCRDIKGIEPISRIRVNRYVYMDEDNDSRQEFAMPIPKSYGEEVEGFLESLTPWLRNKQKEIVDPIVQEMLRRTTSSDIMSDFSRAGGEYADMSDGEVMNNFFNTTTLQGDVSVKDTEARKKIWEEEINNIMKEYNEDLKFCSIYGDVFFYDNRLYVTAGANIKFIFNLNPLYSANQIKFEEIKSKLEKEFTHDYTINRDERWRQQNLLYSFLKDVGLSDSESDIGIKLEGSALVIEFSIHHDDPNEPDDVRDVGERIKYFESKYYDFYRKQIVDLINYALYQPNLDHLSVEQQIPFELKHLEIVEKSDGQISVNSDPYEVIAAPFRSPENKKGAEREIKDLIKRKLERIQDYIYNHQPELFKTNIKRPTFAVKPEVTIVSENPTILYLSFTLKYEIWVEHTEQIVKNLTLFDNNYENIMESLKSEINKIIINESSGRNYNWYQRSLTR